MKAFFLLTAAFVRMYVRDRLTVLLSLALMVFMMVLFGLVMGEEQFRVELPVAVWDRAANAESRRVVQAIGGDELLTVVPVQGEAEMLEQIRGAKVIAGLVIGGGPAVPQAAGAAPAAAGTAVAAAAPGAASGVPPGSRIVTSESMGKWPRVGVDRLQQVLLEARGQQVAGQWPVEARPIAVVQNRYIDFIFPGMLAMAIMQTCLASGIVLLHARKIGVLRRLRLTPVSVTQLFGGFLGGRLLVVALHLLALTLVAVLGFGAHVLAPWVPLAAVIALGCLTFMALGVMVAAIAPSFEAGNLLVQLFSFPMSFLCGVFFKVESMPAYVAWLPKVLPLTYLVDVVRGMVNLGTPVAAYGLQLGVLAGWLTVALLVAAAGLRWAQREEG